MIIRTHRRAGFSLTEALIAIFVMALGLMGVLSLFPLGAMHMLRANKDDHTAQGNHNASTLIRQYWRDQIALTPMPPSNPLPQNATDAFYAISGRASPPQPLKATPPYRDPFVDAMLFPNAPFWSFPYAVPPAFQSLNPKLNPYSSARSYPVYLDPIGWANPNTLLQPQQFFIAGDPFGIPRRSLTTLEQNFSNVLPTQGPTYLPVDLRIPQIKQQGFCVQLDDQAFGKDGTPADGTGNFTSNSTSLFNMAGQVQRDGRYSWAFLLVSRPTLRDQADLTIVVYSGRSVDGPSEEKVFPTIFTPGSTEVTLLYGNNPRPKVRQGSWILDATMTNNGTPLPEGPHGYFYRVINVNDDNSGVLILEIQTPVQAVANQQPTTLAFGRGVIMDGVSEVFERKILNSVIMPAP